MSAPATVVVRMYRNLLGDCFLIRLAGPNEEKSHILIDCGLLQGVEHAKETLTAIATDIEQTTGGHIDLLVVTHEHYDHISGFSLAKDILLDPDRIKYGALWMAWTEDPSDQQATALRNGLETRKTAFARMSLALEGTDRLDQLTQDLSKFIGPLDTSPAMLGAAPSGRLTGSAVMDALKRVAPTTFLSPGTVLSTPGGITLPSAVLGPPRSLDRLYKDLPSQGSAQETYLADQLLGYSLLGVDPATGEQTAELKSPFSSRYVVNAANLDGKAGRWTKSPESSAERWFAEHYLAAQDSDGRAQDYRRIDGDWSESASALALKLDSDTNNTSLVLAFRLPDDSFLLFAADAQVGNWLSWHDQTYAFADRALSATDILNKTRFYKVGHHGSHNATLRALGLELMVHPELSAMVSTIEQVAKEQGTKGWLMPDPDVKAALLAHTKGRLIRGDRLWHEDKDVSAYPASPAFTAALDESNPLYVELTLFPGSSNRRKGPKHGRKPRH